ncbi:MAG: phosphoglucosamine mutase [Spirochaetia bacterium]|nr:phosphoglucosamine mutase [Spirochaetia bacterium]
MKINLTSPTLKFSVSGMRGLFPEDINANNIAEIIHAFHNTVKTGPIALARDNRSTGEAIENILVGIFQSLGREVHKLGIVPTPTIKAYIQNKKLPGGIMISASHNPATYTAFKFIKQGGFFFEKNENDQLISFLKTNTNNEAWGNYKTQGMVIDAHAKSISLHLDSVIEKVFPSGKAPSNSLKVALDTLGACATEIIPQFLDKIGVKYVSLFPEILYNFPRPPEPVASSLSKLSKFIIENKCDIGFAFDPDADRLAIVGPDGKAIGEELTLPLAMMKSLSNKKGNVIVNLSSSLYNEYSASQNNCKVFRSKVGEANVVEMMKKKKALFGGEGNGGVIDPDIPSFGRDSLAGVAWILSLMIDSKKSIPQLLENFPSYFMRKEAIKGDAKTVIKISKNIAKMFPTWKIDTSDGYHHLASDLSGWIHIRSSNTEPVIRILAEANSKDLLMNLLKTARL